MRADVDKRKIRREMLSNFTGLWNTAGPVFRALVANPLVDMGRAENAGALEEAVAEAAEFVARWSGASDAGAGEEGFCAEQLALLDARTAEFKGLNEKYEDTARRRLALLMRSGDIFKAKSGGWPRTWGSAVDIERAMNLLFDFSKSGGRVFVMENCGTLEESLLKRGDLNDSPEAAWSGEAKFNAESSFEGLMGASLADGMQMQQNVSPGDLPTGVYDLHFFAKGGVAATLACDAVSAQKASDFPAPAAEPLLDAREGCEWRPCHLSARHDNRAKTISVCFQGIDGGGCVDYIRLFRRRLYSEICALVWNPGEGAKLQESRADPLGLAKAGDYESGRMDGGDEPSFLAKNNKERGKHSFLQGWNVGYSASQYERALDCLRPAGVKGSVEFRGHVEGA